MNNQIISNYSAFKFNDDNLITLKGVANNSFIGYYLRGIDIVKINFTLTDSETGEPISNVKLSVFLNISESESIYVGQNTTDDYGYFEYEFNVLTSYPSGPVNITSIFPGDVKSGLPEIKIIYSAIFYSRVSLSIFLEKQITPLFEKNITIRSWLAFDNGTILHINGLNFTLSIENLNTSDVVRDFIISDDSGIATYIYNYSDTGAGLYNVSILFNATENHFDLPYTVLVTQTLLKNGSIIGEPILSSFRTFKVILASKIDLAFVSGSNFVTSLNVLRNETIHIIGRYYNILGNPEGGKEVRVSIYKGNQLVYSETQNTNSTGYFTLEIEASIIANNYGLGGYKANATVTGENVIVNELSLLIYSAVEVLITQDPPSLIMQGEIFTLSGNVVDSTTGDPLPNSKVKVVIRYDSTEIELANTSTNTDGLFEFTNLTIPLSIDSPSITLTVIARGPIQFLYLPDRADFDISIYKFFYLTMRINETSAQWAIGKGYVTPINEPTISVKSGDRLLFTVNITDNYERPVSIDYTIIINGLIWKHGKTNNSGLDKFIIMINETTRITIRLSGLSPLTFTIEIAGAQEPLVSLIDPIMVLLIIPFVITGVVIYRYKDKLMVYIPIISGTVHGEETLTNLIDDIEVLLKNKIYGEASEKIMALLSLIAKRLNLEVKSSDTPRELLNKIYPRIEKDIYKVLEQLVNIYEIVRYGERMPDNTTVQLTLSNLRKLELFSETIYELEV